METPRGILEKNTSGTGRADAEAGPVTDLSVRGEEAMVPEPVHALLVTPSPELNRQHRRCPPAFPAACPVVGWPRRGVPSAAAHPSAPQGHPSAPRAHPPAPRAHPPAPRAHPPAPRGHPPAPGGEGCCHTECHSWYRSCGSAALRSLPLRGQVRGCCRGSVPGCCAGSPGLTRLIHTHSSWKKSSLR